MASANLAQRVTRRLTTFRCRACAARYPRRNRWCPDCRTRKYDYGYGIRKLM
jgi:hypothetical protein